MKPAAKPLFIPLKTEPYNLFKLGFKTHEIRLNSGKWNRRVCFPGRRVILSKGYGKHDRLYGRIVSVEIMMASLLPADYLEAFEKHFGENQSSKDAILIGIEIDG